MKKNLLVMVALMPLLSFAERESVNGIDWTYTISDGKAQVGTGVSQYYGQAIPTSTSGSITIPATLGGCPVTSIGSYAFYDCKWLDSVAIPSSVTSIGKGAFSYCDLKIVFVEDEPQECVLDCFGDQMWYQKTGVPIDYEWVSSYENGNGI